MVKSLKAYRIKVVGRVQRVGYRRYILDLAQELQLQGYVKNEKDGSVTVFIQGEKDKLDEFIERAKTPPKPALVKELKIKEATVKPNMKYFEIKPGKLWEELHEGFGAMQNIFMEYWREFKDYRQEFKDYREEFRDYRQEFRDFARRTDENFQKLMEKYGEISEKLTVILNTLIEESKKTTKLLEIIQEESRETREILLENIKLLREAIEKIK